MHRDKSQCASREIASIRVMAATAEAYIKLAQSLPPRLIRFFTRYQPRIVNRSIAVTPSSTSTVSNSDPNTEHEQAVVVQSVLEPSNLPNPFQCRKSFATGRWHDPIYSLRRQADLVKMARANGVEELLPPTTKGTEARIQKKAVHGLRVRGTGVGKRVKGKKWERMMNVKLEARKQAMEKMPALIAEWKEVSYTC